MGDFRQKVHAWHANTPLRIHLCSQSFKTFSNISFLPWIHTRLWGLWYATYCVGLSHCCMPNEFAFLAWGCRVCRGLFDCSAPPLVNSVTSISPSNEVKLAVYSGSSGSTNNPPFIPLFFFILELTGLRSCWPCCNFFLHNYITYHYIIMLFFYCILLPQYIVHFQQVQCTKP